ncbi:hypothetical protein ACLMO3_20500 [Yersinia enterocolitica]|uniref:hypothetical protein n=1 Tax=Yersinia enterocolitica TaxID=630 RepID=UPI00398D0583
MNSTISVTSDNHGENEKIMKNILLTPLLGSVLLLTGCVGMNSDFTCNETVQDQCMTMEQANSKARFKQEGAGAIKGKPVSPVVLPAVVNPQPSPAPVTTRVVVIIAENPNSSGHHLRSGKTTHHCTSPECCPPGSDSVSGHLQ